MTPRYWQCLTNGMCVWLRVEAGQRRLWTCTLHGDGPRSVSLTLSDGPSNTYTYWAGPLYTAVGPKENRPNGVFLGVHVKNRSTHGLGHNSQFHWISARVKGNICLSGPLYLYYCHLSVPNINILLFLPKTNPLTTAPSSGLVTIWR